MPIVHTQYGPGRIIGQETLRGRTQYKVAGNGFEVWLDETKLGAYQSPETIDFSAPHWDGHELGDQLSGDAFGPGDYTPISEDEYNEYADPRGLYGRDLMRTHPDYLDDDDPDTRYAARQRQAWAPIDHDNSTRLPYNPDPQHEAIGTPGDDGSATIQPIHHIDPNERLHPSDSLSFEEEDDDEDGPGPNAGLFARANRHQANPLAGAAARAAVPVIADTLTHGLGGDGSGSDSSGQPPGGDNKPLVNPGKGGRGLVDKASDAIDETIDALSPGPGWWPLIHKSHTDYRPAGLSDRYIDITAGADYHNDPVAQFRHDPDAYINRIGHLMDEGLNPRFAEYMDLVEADGGVRTAAWKDVRAKAMRLKTSGAVHVKDLAPSRIMASVDGDHGTYDVVILKGASFGDQSIANWHCGCEWGRWAFKRKFSYVGRLCSHAYASYLTMQSAALKSQKPTRRDPSDMVIKRRNPGDRAYPMPVFAAGLKTADNLQNGPQRLTPELVVNDTDDAQQFLDVTKDEREDTGPDDVVSEKDIVHFARLMRHCEVTEQPYPRQLVAFLSRYAGCADDSGDDTQSDYRAHDSGDADEYLDKIRADGDRKQEDDFGDMAERVHRIQKDVEEARAHGADADRFVAMLKTAIPGVGNDNIIRPDGTSRVEGWGASPDTAGQFWQNVGESYINPEDMKPGSAVRKQLDKENPQGTERRNKEYGDGKPSPAPTKSAPSGSSDPEAFAKSWPNQPVPDRSKGNSPNSKSADPPSPAGVTGLSPGQGGNGGQVPPQPSASGGKDSGGTGGNAGESKGGTGGTGGGAYQPPGGGMTSGNVSDGGVAGAENGNNSSIGKDQLDADGYYTVQKGDTLTDIAQRAYGDMNKYQDLAKGNSIANPDVINEGQRIKIDNPTGNNGVSGDKTNPAGGGSDNNIATPEPVNTDAAAGKATAPTPPAGGAATTDAIKPAEAPAAAPAPPPAAAAPPNEGKPAAARRTAREWLRWAAGNDGSAGGDGGTSDTAAQSDPSAPQSPTTGTQATPKATSPGAAPATNPATGGGAADRTIGPSLSGDTYDPQQQSPSARADTSSAASGLPATGLGQQPGGGRDIGGGGMDMGQIGDMIGQGVGIASDIAAPIASGIGNAVSGIASGLGSIFGSRQDFDDWVRYAYPTADGEGKLEPHTHPFAGSGYPGSLEIGTSEDYADKARKKMDDVTDLDDHDVHASMDKWQKQSSRGPQESGCEECGEQLVQESDGTWSHVDEYGDPIPAMHHAIPFRESSYDDNSDIVRTFQARLGETALGAGAGQGAGRFDDIAGAAQGFLRTAGRNYSLAEQDALIREGDKGGARNLDSLDLRNTHYEDMHTLGW